MQSEAFNPDWSEYAFIALGSNLGASTDLFSEVIPRLRSLSDSKLLESSWWKTSPVDCPPGSPDFLNAVVAFKPRPETSGHSLLVELQSLEKEFGRRPKKVINEPRPLDLDIIAFKNEIRNDSSLTLPHPRAHQRRFVLQPLVEIASDLILPGFEYPVNTLLERLKSDEQITRLQTPCQ
jgi:2-amino-4-hydroxy-6-hydroxymethyldihydropteridine diphosphokinase